MSQILIDRFGWRDAYQLFGAVALCLLPPLLLLPWRLFATGSPHVVKKADASFADDRLDLASAMRHHTFWALFFYLLLHRGGDVRDHRADRGLSDRCRLLAVYGGDRLGLFRYRAALRHARCVHPRRPHRPPAVGAVQLRRLDRRTSSCCGCCSGIRTIGCSPVSSSASAA